MSTAGSMIREPYRGVTQVVRYNWPFYVGALGAALGVVVAVTLLEPPELLTALALAAAALALFWSIASIVVAHWVYDRSPLYRWDWLAAELERRPARWVNVHAGLDETSAELLRIFPARATVLDIYDQRVMSEPSIVRARQTSRPPVPALPADPEHLPLEDGVCDGAFVIFAAHEIRRPESRDRFFAELRRVLQPGSRAVLIESLRDLPNFIAYGPGFLHFISRREWRRTVRAGGFTIARERSITPFVRIFVLDRS